MEEVVDSLNFSHYDDILKLIGEDDKMLLSYQVIKVNRYGLSQERNMVITQKNIYNLKKKSK